MRERYTHLVQPHVSVQNVHVLAQLFVRLVRALHPLWVRMCVPDELREVNDGAQHVAEPVEVLDGLEQLVARPPSADYAFGEQLGADESGQGEVLERRGRDEGGLSEEARW